MNTIEFNNVYIQTTFTLVGPKEYKGPLRPYFHAHFDDDFNHEFVKNRIFAVHLHDNDKSDDQHLLPYDGTVNWNLVVDKLKDCNYNGPITLELYYRKDYLKDNISNEILNYIDIDGERYTINHMEELKFGEYANPSFESQVETIGKARQNGTMSIETSVDELYGDSKSDDWKKEEVKRIKEELGVATVEETSEKDDITPIGF